MKNNNSGKSGNSTKRLVITIRSEEASIVISSPVARTGNRALDLVITKTLDQKVIYNQLPGSALNLDIYNSDYVPVCSGDMMLFKKIIPDFEQFNTQLIVISIDNILQYGLLFFRVLDLKFPLSSDFYPNDAGYMQHGEYRRRDKDSGSKCVLFVIDIAGTAQWNYVSPSIAVYPGANGAHLALESLDNNISNSHIMEAM